MGVHRIKRIRRSYGRDVVAKNGVSRSQTDYPYILTACGGDIYWSRTFDGNSTEPCLGEVILPTFLLGKVGCILPRLKDLFTRRSSWLRYGRAYNEECWLASPS